MSPRLWILNLDGEHELEAGKRYQPTARLAQLVEAQRAGLWSGASPLVRPGDLVLADPTTSPHLIQASAPLPCLRITSEGARAEAVEPGTIEVAHAWLATERARAIAAALGAQLEWHTSATQATERWGGDASRPTDTPAEPASSSTRRSTTGSDSGAASGSPSQPPSLPTAPRTPGHPPPPTATARPVSHGPAHASSVSHEPPKTSRLAQVNARDFAAALHATLTPGAPLQKHIATTLDAAIASRPAPRGWLARRRFGAAGRGRRKLHAGDQPASARAWLEASLRTGPLVLEPLVRIEHEYTRSGTITHEGHVHMSEPCFQATTREGAWTHTERRGHEVPPADDAALAHAFEAAGRALADAGYAGPFGIDAFRYRDPWNEAHSHLNPLSEINARYTMDWALALAPRRTRAT